MSAPTGDPPPITTPKMPIGEAMKRGMTHHRAGRLEKAAIVYRSILRSVPEHADSLHLLGVVAHQRGRHEKAVRLIDGAIHVRGDVAAYHFHRAEALRKIGEADAAIAGYRDALRLDAKQASAARHLACVLLERGEADEAIAMLETAIGHAPDRSTLRLTLGNAHRTAGNLREAEVSFRRGLEINPHDAPLLNNLALLQAADGRVDEARASLGRAIVVEPDRVQWRFNLGKVAQDAGDLRQAAEIYRDVLLRSPRMVEAHNNLAATLHALGEYASAEATYRDALQIAPQQIELHFGLGNTLRLAGRLDEATACYEQVLRYDARHTGALNNAGLARKFQNRFDESSDYFARLLEIDPDHVDGRWNQILTMLLLGDWRQGWPALDWRWRRRQSPPRQCSLREWDGQSLSGRSVLVYGEQGIGDEIMFASCLPDVIAAAEDCVIECDERLAELFSRSFPAADVVARREWSDLDWITQQRSLDVQIAAGSLPRHLRGAPEEFPERGPHLVAAAGRIRHWKERLAQLGDGLKVGISWRGGSNIEPESQQRRSTSLIHWRRVLRIPGATFVNVQYGPAADEADDDSLIPPSRIHRFTELDPTVDLDDFAALLTSLDLVISVDNSTVHLAAALGTTTYAALPFSPDWRWLRSRSDSPWYQSLRLFRQTAPGEWDGVFCALAAALGEMVAPLEDESAAVDFRGELRAPYFGSIPDVSLSSAEASSNER